MFTFYIHFQWYTRRNSSRNSLRNSCRRKASSVKNFWMNISIGLFSLRFWKVGTRLQRIIDRLLKKIIRKSKSDCTYGRTWFFLLKLYTVNLCKFVVNLLTCFGGIPSFGGIYGGTFLEVSKTNQKYLKIWRNFFWQRLENYLE